FRILGVRHMVARSCLFRWVLRLGASAALVAATCAFQVASASASTVLSEGWESGTLDVWSAADTSTNDGQNAADPVWQALTNPQNVSVTNPGINPDLVTLPDSGSLPSAFDGSNVAWFGNTSTGTYCGA